MTRAPAAMAISNKFHLHSFGLRYEGLEAVKLLRLGSAIDNFFVGARTMNFGLTSSVTMVCNMVLAVDRMGGFGPELRMYSNNCALLTYTVFDHPVWIFAPSVGLGVSPYVLTERHFQARNLIAKITRARDIPRSGGSSPWEFFSFPGSDALHVSVTTELLHPQPKLVVYLFLFTKLCDRIKYI
jgi:hypothetical protein